MLISLRSVAAAAAIALGLSCAGVADAANFSGTWSFVGTMNGFQTTPVCKLTQVGNKIAGPCKGPNAAGPGAGSVIGSTIVISWHHVRSNALGVTGIATYRGVWGADGVIRGTWIDSAAPGYTGTFSAQKV